MWWLVADLIRWGLPLVGVAAGFFVARRRGWRMLLAGCVAWGAIAAVSLAVLDNSDLSLSETVVIVVWLFVFPWLVSGGLALLVRNRHRHRESPATRRD